MKPLEILVVAIVSYIIFTQVMNILDERSRQRRVVRRSSNQYEMPRNLLPYTMPEEAVESMTNKSSSVDTNLIQSSLEKSDNATAMIVAAGLQDQVKSHREYNKHLNPGHSISSGSRSAFLQEMSGRTDINVHSGTAAFSQEYLKNYRPGNGVPMGPVSSVDPSV
jgi:hypothetical protein